MRARPRLTRAATACLWLAVALRLAPTLAAGAHDRYVWQLPRGFPVPAVPADNPMSQAKVALGGQLFFDTRLSLTGQYSCGSCHDPRRSYADDLAQARGATGATLPHNAMALINVAYNLRFGWSASGTDSLEAQMRQPMFNQHPIELGLRGRETGLIAALRAERCYRDAFASAFGGEPQPVTMANVIKAIAAFERTLISGDSPFDRYVFGGDHAALSDQAKRGMALFYSPRAGCSGCHSGFNFSGNWRDAQGATGAPSVANDGSSDVPMRVPTLRNVALTAPYMHDGRYATLEAVLEHYSSMGADGGGAARDPRLPRQPLTAQEQRELLAFLRSLTDDSFAARTTASVAQRSCAAAR